VEYAVLAEALRAAGPDPVRVLTIYEPASRATLPGARGRWLDRVDARAAVRQERRAIRTADATVVFTDRDRDDVARGAVGSSVLTIPLGLDVPDLAMDPAGDGRTVLFVGNFVHRPNVDAARWLVRDVLPSLREAVPTVRVEIVGPDPPAGVRELASEAVVVTGEVPSVTPHLDRAAVVAAPIVSGGGMRVKVLEALAAGKAVVATPLATEGSTAAQDAALVVALDASEMGTAIARLLADRQARVRLAERARAWALEQPSWSDVAARYGALYAELAATRRRPTT
jgi:glycosyltransferase involved in cell wall biosynthesis